MECVTKSICINGGCSISVASKTFIIDASHVEIKRLAAVVIVGGLGETKSPSNKYVLLDIFFCSNNGQTAHIQQEIDLVNEPDVTLLIGIEIQTVEGIVIDPQNCSMTIRSCQN